MEYMDAQEPDEKNLYHAEPVRQDDHHHDGYQDNRQYPHQEDQTTEQNDALQGAGASRMDPLGYEVTVLPPIPEGWVMSAAGIMFLDRHVLTPTAMM
jgi:hypothetical protein